MDGRTTLAHKFRTKRGFKKYDISLTKVQSVLTKIINSFERENMQKKCNVLCYRTELCFHDNELTIELMKIVIVTRDIYYEIKKQKAIEQENGCKFVRIDPDKIVF